MVSIDSSKFDFMTITILAHLCDNWERNVKTRNKLAFTSSLSQLYARFHIWRYLENNYFFLIWLMGQFLFLFGHTIEIRVEPAQLSPAHLDPAMMLFDWPFQNRIFFSNAAGRAISLRASFIWSKTNIFCSTSHIEKINSFRDMALFENLYMTVKTRS